MTEGKSFPDNSLILVAPAKVVREIKPEDAEKFAAGARHYVERGQRFKRELKRID